MEIKRRRGEGGAREKGLVEFEANQGERDSL